MKGRRLAIERLIFGSAIALTVGINAQPLITSVNPTKDGAIQLHWQSDPNAVYRIDGTPELTDPITWYTLYEDCPAQGTNTLWADAGSQDPVFLVSHPRDSIMRFYRVVQTGTNNLASAARVSVTSPTNGATFSGDLPVTVSVNSALDIDTIRLYVDGAEVAMNGSDETNFVINTCQFANGQHQIFAVAANTTGAESTDDVNQNDFSINYGVSPFVTVTFANLITDYRSYLRFQAPAYSETNFFTADFALPSDWALMITNDFGAAVRTVTGTGTSMQFIWDGTDNLGVQVPGGGYGAVLSASQSASLAMTEPAPINPAISEAIAAGKTTYTVQPPPMPDVRVQTNGTWTWVSWEQVYGPQPPIEVPIPQAYLDAAAGLLPSSPTPQDGPQSDPPTSQTTVLKPMPSVWIDTQLGTVGIAYQGNHPLVWWPADDAPDDGIWGTIKLNTRSPAGAYGPLKLPSHIAYSFRRFMAAYGYRTTIYEPDSELQADYLRGVYYGGYGMFDFVNFGFLIGHGVYGLDPDFNISWDGPLQTYYPVYTGAVGYDWVRLSEFDFGNAPSSKLRWMCMLNCNNLVDSVYQDCWDKEALPVGNNLHLLCGAKTAIFMASQFSYHFANALTGHGGVDRQNIMNSWFHAGAKTQGTQPGGPHMSVGFRVIGWPNCANDDLVNYQDPDSGNPADIQNWDQTVFQYP